MDAKWREGDIRPQFTSTISPPPTPPFILSTHRFHHSAHIQPMLDMGDSQKSREKALPPPGAEVLTLDDSEVDSDTEFFTAKPIRRTGASSHHITRRVGALASSRHHLSPYPSSVPIGAAPLATFPPPSAFLPPLRIPPQPADAQSRNALPRLADRMPARRERAPTRATYPPTRTTTAMLSGAARSAGGRRAPSHLPSPSGRGRVRARIAGGATRRNASRLLPCKLGVVI